MSEENKALYRRIIEEFGNKGDRAAVDELYSADLVDHVAIPGNDPGNEGLKQIITSWRDAFPDLHTHIEDLIAEGDRVVARLMFHGTHQGEFMGIPATGKQIRVNEICIVRFADGKVVEHWEVCDYLSMMQQLGVVSPLA